MVTNVAFAQYTSSSACPIQVRSTTILLQNPIWEPQRAAVQRMEWFLHLLADFDVVFLFIYEN